MAMKFTGSICLSDIPKSEVKKVKRKDGSYGFYLNISVHENDKPFTNSDGKVISDHFISCAPKKEERVKDVDYIVGNLRTWQERQNVVTIEDINAAPVASDNDRFPWDDDSLF